MARRYIVIARNIADSCRFEENGELMLEEAKIEEKAGDIKKAIKCVERSIPLLTGQHSHSLPDAYLRLGNLQYAKGDYVAALENADSGIGACEKYSANLQLGKLYKLKSDCFMKTGQPDSAVVYLRKANIQIEKGNALQLQHLENERRMMAQMDEKDKKAAVTQVRMSFQSRLIVALVVSVLLMGICLTVVIYNHRRRKRLYDSLVRKNQETLSLVDRLRAESEEGRNRSAVVFGDSEILEPEAEEVSSVETSVTEEDPEQTASAEPVNKEKGMSREKGTLLFEEACRLMREERLYADPRFTREDFIERLGTNHTYFTRLIKDFTGANFTQFLNSYRIEEAIRILSDPEKKDCPLKQICSDVGFGSITSFYKFFQAATGVTPSIYRKTVLEKK